MEFKQLEAYVNVYELKSFSKAAEEMYLSQPSISAYINALEKELGTQLIFRSTKEFIPTKAGAMFYEYAKDMLSLREKSISSIKNMSGADVGSIDLMASTVPSQYILPELLGQFHQQYPNIVFHLEQADSAAVVKGISTSRTEVGFVGARMDNPKCVYEEFMSERLIMIAPYDEHYINMQPEQIPHLVRNEYFITRETGSGTRVWYEEFLRRLDVEPEMLKVSAQLSNTQSVILAVAGGLGLSIVSEIAARHYMEQKMITAIDVGFVYERKFYLVTKKNRIQTRTVDTFLQFVLSHRHL